MITPPTSPDDLEIAWRLELEAMLEDLDVGDVAAVTPERLPVHLGALPSSLASLAAHVIDRMDAAAELLRSQLGEIDDELKSSSTRGARRWATTTPAPSQLDCSA